MNELDAIKSELAYARQELGRVSRDLETLKRDHRKLLIALSPLSGFGVCMNAACHTGELVPHMIDEREHRSTGDVLKERL